jgi:dihydrodipicolinate synthase/N-acetylneuraminate lyase
MDASNATSIRAHLRAGHVIPAHPLALTRERRLDERRQRALTRYYLAAGAGGVAVGVHTTQFAIRDSQHGLFRPVLELAIETARETLRAAPRPFAMIAGLCGHTAQARSEADIAAQLGYHAGLLSLADWRREPEAEVLEHCRVLADIMPLVGFYLQPAVGGRVLSYAFWREFAEIPNVWAIKVAPFNRYATIDVVRAVLDSGRDDIALYTGNDDSILVDLLTPFIDRRGSEAPRYRWFDGGLLGQWAVWTRTAVRLLEDVKRQRQQPMSPHRWMNLAAALTDANGAIFDAAHQFAGCIPGIHEVLRRQGLLAGTWCLDEQEVMAPGQDDEITRVTRSYPELADDEFVRENVAEWLRA